MREAKEAFASASAESRRANRAKRAVHAPRRRRNVEEIAKMLDIEDVYPGEDSSIQCVVRQKSSLVAKDNLVGEELHRRCQELFKKKYGAREWTRAPRGKGRREKC